MLARREWDMDALWQDLLNWLDKQPRSVRHRPQLSDHTLRLMQEARLIASLSGEAQIRSVHLLMALVEKQNLIQCDGLWPLLTLGQRQLERLRPLLDAQSDERPPAQQEAALAQPHGGTWNLWASRGQRTECGWAPTRRCRTRWTNSLSTSPPKPETA